MDLADAASVLRAETRWCLWRPIHLSTDYVFDSRPAFYGASKLASEEAVLPVVWLYSLFGGNFVNHAALPRPVG